MLYTAPSGQWTRSRALHHSKHTLAASCGPSGAAPRRHGPQPSNGLRHALLVMVRPLSAHAVLHAGAQAQQRLQRTAQAAACRVPPSRVAALVCHPQHILLRRGWSREHAQGVRSQRPNTVGIITPSILIVPAQPTGPRSRPGPAGLPGERAGWRVAPTRAPVQQAHPRPPAVQGQVVEGGWRRGAGGGGVAGLGARRSRRVAQHARSQEAGDTLPHCPCTCTHTPNPSHTALHCACLGRQCQLECQGVLR